MVPRIVDDGLHVASFFSEPLAYAGVASWAWRIFPVSAFIELSAVLLFALNIGKTLATPIPTWFGREQIKGTMMLYWYVSSYPATRRLLIEAGLATLQRVRSVPKTLTLDDAVAADGADLSNVLKKLGDFFEAHRILELHAPTAKWIVASIFRLSAADWVRPSLFVK